VRKPRESAAFLVALIAAGAFVAASQNQPPSSQTAASSEPGEPLLALGKNLFVERCAKCHDERGDKLLRSGAPLNERKLTEEEISRAVAGRFKDKTDQERRAVTLYVMSFLKK
jgi:mono/diheme cytochrome c family protein